MRNRCFYHHLVWFFCPRRENVLKLRRNSFIKPFQGGVDLIYAPELTWFILFDTTCTSYVIFTLMKCCFEVLFGTCNSNYIITVCLPSSYMKTIYSIIIIIIVKFTPLEMKN